MIKAKEVKRKLTRKMFNPSKEIQEVIKDKKCVRQKQLLPSINEARGQIAESKQIKVQSMSPRTLHNHLERLIRDGAVRKQIVSHKEVYYAQGPRFSEEWINVHIIEGIARLLNSLDRSVGLIEALRLFKKIRNKPDRIKELENSARMLCRIFDKELPESTDDDYLVMRVHQEDEK